MSFRSFKEASPISMVDLSRDVHPLYSSSKLDGITLMKVMEAGGTSLMMPLLVLKFGIPSTTASGADLLYASLALLPRP